MPNALLALAPVVASGVGSLVKHKQKGAAEKQAEEQRRLEAQQADALAKQQWETQQNSPAAQAARFKATMQFGRLAGAMGGTAKVPPSIAKYYQSLRTMPAYTGTSSYIPTPKKGGGGWDFLGGVTDALGAFDPSALSKPKYAAPTPGLAAVGNAAAGSNLNLAGSPMATDLSTGTLDALTRRLKPQTPPTY